MKLILTNRHTRYYDRGFKIFNAEFEKDYNISMYPDENFSNVIIFNIKWLNDN